MPYVFSTQKISQFGFTLIEILVTIGIIGLLAAFSLPNIKNFSDSLTLTSTRSDLISLLRKAQSNAQSGLKCSNGLRALAWEVELNPSNYQLVPHCNPAANPPTDPRKTIAYPLEISMLTTSCPNDVKASILFTNTKLEIFCYTSGVKDIWPLSSPLTITLHSAKVGPDQNIIINQGGNFSFN